VNAFIHLQRIKAHYRHIVDSVSLEQHNVKRTFPRYCYRFDVHRSGSIACALETSTSDEHDGDGEGSDIASRWELRSRFTCTSPYVCLPVGRRCRSYVPRQLHPAIIVLPAEVSHYVRFQNVISISIVQYYLCVCDFSKTVSFFRSFLWSWRRRPTDGTWGRCKEYFDHAYRCECKESTGMPTLQPVLLVNDPHVTVHPTIAYACTYNINSIYWVFFQWFQWLFARHATKIVAFLTTKREHEQLCRDLAATNSSIVCRFRTSLLSDYLCSSRSTEVERR